MDELLEQLQSSHMVFITAGMGGGTGTGAAPVIARAVREQGILTVGVVTKPFHFEGAHRMRVAEGGLAELQQYVDTLIVIPNQNLFRIANERTTFAEAFKLADNVLHMGVRGVTDLMVMPGLINLDFADIRTVMSEMGKAMMGTGEGSGERRAIEAAEAAISNPLLDEVSMRGARGVLINITGGHDMTLFEVDEAANRIKEEVDPDANIIVGSTLNEALDGEMRVSVVATGIEARGAAAAAAMTEVAGEQAEHAQHAQLPVARAARESCERRRGPGEERARQEPVRRRRRIFRGARLGCRARARPGRLAAPGQGCNRPKPRSRMPGSRVPPSRGSGIRPCRRRSASRSGASCGRPCAVPSGRQACSNGSPPASATGSGKVIPRPAALAPRWPSPPWLRRRKIRTTCQLSCAASNLEVSRSLKDRL